MITYQPPALIIGNEGQGRNDFGAINPATEEVFGELAFANGAKISVKA
jgi:hypothetical protein